LKMLNTTWDRHMIRQIMKKHHWKNVAAKVHDVFNKVLTRI